jgi:pimeloyl-ACP methyl ester carboxylesterase
MTSFVLVHGGWHGGWCYNRVAKILRDGGHDVFTPTLTGLGERSHLLQAGIDLDTHITDVMNVIKWEGLADVVLCGHSYGGFVVTGVCDRIPDKVASVVYLDAFVPEDGDTCMSFLAPERQKKLLINAEEMHAGIAVDAPPPEFYRVNAKDIEWVRRNFTPHPLGSLLQPIRLTGDYQRVRRTYVYAKGETISRPWYEKCLADPTWKVLVTDKGGHDQMVDDPDTVAQILMQSAA